MRFGIIRVFQQRGDLGMKMTTGMTALLGAVAAMSLTAAAHAGQITVVSWGGAYTTSQVEAYHKPWMAKTGNTIVSADYNGGLAEVKAQVQSGNVTWDVVDVETSEGVSGCNDGLFEKIDASKLPKGENGAAPLDDFVPGAITDCAISTIAYANIFGYDSTKFPGDKPTKVADFFDTKKFPGKRGMKKEAKVNLEMALMADGVAAADVYKVLATKEGVDRAFKKLDSIKSSIVWWEAGAQPPQLLASGEVTMTTAYNGRLFTPAVTENKPFVIVWDGQQQVFDTWAIPKGSKNKEAALDFIAFSTSTKPLADQAKYIPYGPARKSSAPLVGKFQDGKTEMAPHMPTNPENMKNAIVQDVKFWADHYDELNERFIAWIGK
jgi:putative spermidine/putrescine transport system substrate-binding protein